MKKIKCVVCKTTKLFPSHGRYIDGSWAEDYKIPKNKWEKWVCSFSCFRKLFQEK
jgi:hypothetical protein